MRTIPSTVFQSVVNINANVDNSLAAYLGGRPGAWAEPVVVYLPSHKALLQLLKAFENAPVPSPYTYTREPVGSDVVFLQATVTFPESCKTITEFAHGRAKCLVLARPLSGPEFALIPPARKRNFGQRTVTTPDLIPQLSSSWSYAVPRQIGHSKLPPDHKNDADPYLFPRYDQLAKLAGRDGSPGHVLSSTFTGRIYMSSL